MTTQYNLPHPEARDGEVWITNSTSIGFVDCNHSTKRLGDVAYDIYGNPIRNIGGHHDLFPLFVSSSELTANNISWPRPRSVDEYKAIKAISKFNYIEIKDF